MRKILVAFSLTAFIAILAYMLLMEQPSQDQPAGEQYMEVVDPLLGGTVPRRPTEFKTYLAEQKTEGHSDTTLKVTSVTTKDGNTLSDTILGDTIVLAINPGASNSETVVCTSLSSLTFSGCTFGYRFDDPLITQASNVKAHAPGEPIIISNQDTFLANQYLTLDGTATVNSTNTWNGIQTYATLPQSSVTCANNVDFCTKDYIDGIAVAGGSNADTNTLGFVEVSAPNEWNGGPTTSTIVAHYKLNDHTATTVAINHANTSINGTSSQNTDLFTTTTSKISGAFGFDGSSGSVNAGSDSTLDDIWDGGGTFAAWIYPYSDGESSFGHIAEKDSSNGWYIALWGQTGSLTSMRFSQDFDGGGATWNTSGDLITLNAWNHVVITYDSDSTANNPIMYINGSVVGILESASPSGTRDSDAGGNLTIGNRPADDRTFDGAIDDVRVYNKVLTADEVSFLYNEGEGTEGQDVGSTGARVVASMDIFDRYCGPNKAPVGDTDGYLDIGCLNLGENYAWTGTHTFSGSQFSSTTLADAIVVASSTGKIDDGWLGLSTAGDIVYSDGTQLQGLGIGSFGQVLKTNSGATAPEWSDVTKINITTASTTFTNSSAENTVYAVTIPGGTLGTGDGVKARLEFSDIDRGTSQTYTVRVKYGGTTMLQYNGGSGTSVSDKLYLDVFLYADQATNAQKAHMEGRFFATTDALGNMVWNDTGSGTATEDSTGDLNFTVTWQFGSASNNFVGLETASLQLIN